jgi:tripartite-type tricarboxylate transporter receptor subunit TctC
VQVAFDGISSSLEHIRASELRGLALATASRSEVPPDIPTVSEFVRGYEASGWCGVAVPGNTPIEIIDKLNHEINAGLADGKIKARLGDLGEAVLPGSATDFGRFIAEETEK